MLDLAADLVPLLEAGVPVAAVTVTGVVRSAPRGVGATLAVTRDARVIGSISGGCVESDAVMLGLDALRTGRVRRARFGFTGDGTVTPISAGLACGGAVDVVAYRIDAASVLPALMAARAGAAATLRLDLEGEGLDLHRPAAPRLVILGAGEHAAALCRLGSAAGFAVTVCDDWALLVTRDRFPEAVELVVAAPHDFLERFPSPDARTAVCVLTHDERLDVPALRAALRLPIGFVGAMGARATVARRATLLRAAGVSETELSRLHSPLGLDLGGATAEETALSVIAEIVASRNDADARPLREARGPRLHVSAGHAASPGDATLSCAVRKA
ncbi:XdhC family protein [uncultured Microbacterium sp.]|uniref:XdhC family protein n=1 Tax=uncultured Microbacterium sp. TaxID=191216 RepID=UPI0028D7CE7E|nr:XdhC family protein [uncultured Microbacterium sp.]